MPRCGREVLLMRSKLIAFLLILTLSLGTLSMSGCFFLDTTGEPEEKTYSAEELERIVSEILAERDQTNFEVGEIVIQPGDTQQNLLAASKGLLSAVSVYSTFEVRAVSGLGYFQQIITKDTTSGGSGVIYRMSAQDKVKGDAYIITNYHVVYNAQATSENKIAKQIRVFLYGKEQERYTMDAEFVGGSMLYDIALLKVSDSEVLRSSIATEATFANSDEVALLETAIAIGNPALSGLSATVGHINVASEYVPMTLADDSTLTEMRLLRIDTAVNGGNSGGGLFNDRGEVIGIVNAKIVSSSIDNIAYAIPSNLARSVAESILYYCDGKENEHISRCYVGITLEDTPESETYYDQQTGKVHIRDRVKVATVTAGSLADGVIMVGDELHNITIDGESYAVLRNYNIVESMINARAGDTVVIDLTREGTRMQVTIVLSEDCLSTII